MLMWIAWASAEDAAGLVARVAECRRDPTVAAVVSEQARTLEDGVALAQVAAACDPAGALKEAVARLPLATWADVWLQAVEPETRRDALARLERAEDRAAGLALIDARLAFRPDATSLPWAGGPLWLPAAPDDATAQRWLDTMVDWCARSTRLGAPRGVDGECAQAIHRLAWQRGDRFLAGFRFGNLGPREEMLNGGLGAGAARVAAVMEAHGLTAHPFWVELLAEVRRWRPLPEDVAAAPSAAELRAGLYAGEAWDVARFGLLAWKAPEEAFLELRVLLFDAKAPASLREAAGLVLVERARHEGDLVFVLDSSIVLVKKAAAWRKERL